MRLSPVGEAPFSSRIVDFSSIPQLCSVYIRGIGAAAREGGQEGMDGGERVESGEAGDVRRAPSALEGRRVESGRNGMESSFATQGKLPFGAS